MDANTLNGMEQAAISVISSAVKSDMEGKYPSALISYQEGIQLFLDVIRHTQDKKKQEHLRLKTSEYMTRAEKIKSLVQQQKDSGNYHEQIQITNNSTGFSYESIFKKYLEPHIKSVEVEDPYIRNVHQIYNFLSFCELLVRLCPKLSSITLTTGHSQPQERVSQMNKLTSIKTSLASRNITLNITFSDTLHDREIRLDNGWIIKIGRGLDIYKAVNKFTIGFSDQNLRPCLETTVDIFYKQK